MKRSVRQSNQLHAIIGKLKLSADIKQQLVYDFTNGRETSTKEMEDHECDRLIVHLNGVARQMVQVVPVPPPRFENTKSNVMRRKIISICHEMGWKKPDNKIDMARVNAFCIERGHQHKELDKYLEKELPMLITQFELMLQHFYAKR